MGLADVAEENVKLWESAIEEEADVKEGIVPVHKISCGLDVRHSTTVVLSKLVVLPILEVIKDIKKYQKLHEYRLLEISSTFSFLMLLIFFFISGHT